jgi:hypothetical protein
MYPISTVDGIPADKFMVDEQSILKRRTLESYEALKDCEKESSGSVKLY